MRYCEDKNEANHCVIFYDSHSREVKARVFYNLDLSIECAMMVTDAMMMYPHLVAAGIMIRVASVRNGNVLMYA